jgi:hypothetical protein
MSFKERISVLPGKPDIAPADKGGDPGDSRIRCPLCRWEPRADSRWRCNACNYVWNTFDTGGVCPGCLKQWAMTACHSCHKWSPHSEWYPKY